MFKETIFNKPTILFCGGLFDDMPYVKIIKKLSNENGFDFLSCPSYDGRSLKNESLDDMVTRFRKIFYEVKTTKKCPMFVSGYSLGAAVVAISGVDADAAGLWSPPFFIDSDYSQTLTASKSGYLKVGKKEINIKIAQRLDRFGKSNEKILEELQFPVIIIGDTNSPTGKSWADDKFLKILPNGSRCIFTPNHEASNTEIINIWKSVLVFFSSKLK